MPESPLPEVAGFQVFGRGRIWVFANTIIEETKILGDQGKPPYRETPDE